MQILQCTKYRPRFCRQEFDSAILSLIFHTKELKLSKRAKKLKNLTFVMNRKKILGGVKSLSCNLESVFFNLQFYQNSGSISQKNACLFLYMKWCYFNIGQENLFNIKLLAFYIFLPLSVLWTINLLAITNFISIWSMYSTLHHSWVTVKV